MVVISSDGPNPDPIKIDPSEDGAEVYEFFPFKNKLGKWQLVLFDADELSKHPELKTDAAFRQSYMDQLL